MDKYSGVGEQEYTNIHELIWQNKGWQGSYQGAIDVTMRILSEVVNPILEENEELKIKLDQFQKWNNELIAESEKLKKYIDSNGMLNDYDLCVELQKENEELKNERVNLINHLNNEIRANLAEVWNRVYDEREIFTYKDGIRFVASVLEEYMLKRVPAIKSEPTDKFEFDWETKEGLPDV